MAAVLVYSERVDTACELVAGGKGLAAALGLGVSAVALGPGAGAAASQLAAAGADTVYVSEDAAFEGWPADAVAAGLAQIVEQAGASVVLVGSTRRGKETAPRLAQKLGAGCVSDVSSLTVEDGELVAGRYAFGGATVAREKLGTAVKVFAVMPKTFDAEGVSAGAGNVVSPALSVSSAVGCTKSLADFEWLGEDRIIGLSGAKTAPRPLAQWVRDVSKRSVMACSPSSSRSWCSSSKCRPARRSPPCNPSCRSSAATC